jgi:hypothetical protein
VICTLLGLPPTRLPSWVWDVELRTGILIRTVPPPRGRFGNVKGRFGP